MESCLIVHPKAYSKFHVFYTVIFATNIIALCLMTINYCMSSYSLNYYKEEEPNIDLTGVKSFHFSKGAIQEYRPETSNLGTTGKLFYNCFLGTCTFGEDYACTKRVCYQVKKTKYFKVEKKSKYSSTDYDDDDDDYYYGDDDQDEYETVCEDVESTCTDYHTYEDHSCSEECRRSKKSSCGSYYCSSSSNGYYYSSSKCKHEDDSDDYYSPKSCIADNIIYNWRNYYYEKVNASEYGEHTYLDSAVPANETCPRGKKQCGILDNLGNKLCYDNDEECPINHITLKQPNSTLKYKSVVVDGVTIYYTNQANETGRVLGGFYIDSDLLPKYDKEDCEIISTSSISSLLYSHNNQLYRDSIGFNPYKDKSIDKKGKSYLKWCIPGHGKEKNISKIKELRVVLAFNQSQNLQFVKPIKKNYVTFYFVALPGYIGTFLFLLILLCNFHYKNKIDSKLSCKGFDSKNIVLIIAFTVSFIMIIIGSIISLVYNSQLLAAKESDKQANIFISLYLMNIICFVVNILLILLTIGLFIYLFATPSTLFDSHRTNNEAKEDLRNLADFKDNPDFANLEDFKNNPDYKDSLLH